MRLLYVTDQLYLFGGAEKILTQKLNYWADVFGYEVMVVTSCQQGKKPFFKLSEKVKHVDLEIGYPDGSLYHPKNFKRFVTHYRKLKQLVSGFNPDVVFVVSQRLPHIITPFAAKGYKCYFEYHTSWQGFRNNYEKLSLPHKLKTGIISLARSFAESRYAKIVYLNPTELELFKTKNGIVIPNFCDEAKPQAASARKKNVITLGRLSHEKRYDLLLDAWSKLDPNIEGWELYIYGEGVEREKLERLLQEKQWRNPVYLPGETSSVGEKLNESALYVLSSEVETFPMALLEALSHGLPIVSFDCPSGPRSIITENEDGLLVEPKNSQALANALLTLMNDAERRSEMGENAKHNVQRFSAKKIMKRWDELIKQT